MFIRAKSNQVISEGIRFSLYNTVYIVITAAIFFLLLWIAMYVVFVAFFFVILVAYGYFYYWLIYAKSFIRTAGTPTKSFLIGIFGIIPNVIFFCILSAFIDTSSDSCGFGDVIAMFILLVLIFTMPIVMFISTIFYKDL